MNKETARSEFVLTAAGYPVMVALRGLGVRTYHAIRCSSPTGPTLIR
jgi:hypothetical protein